MEVSDMIDPKEFNILNLIVRVLASHNQKCILMFFYQSGQEFNFTGILPDGNQVNAEFIAKFKELASMYADSMAVIPKDDFNARIIKLLDKWRTKTKQGEIIPKEDGGIEIKFLDK